MFVAREKSSLGGAEAEACGAQAAPEAERAQEMQRSSVATASAVLQQQQRQLRKRGMEVAGMVAVNPKRRKAVWLSFCHGISVSFLCVARLQLPVVVHPVELDATCRQLTAQLYPRLERRVGCSDVEQ